MDDTIIIRKNAIADLLRIRDEFDSVVESLELMGDTEFIKSFKRAKEQIKKRDFADWNAL